MAQDNDISSIDFNVSIEERIKCLKSINTDNCILESIKQNLYPKEAPKDMITEDYVSFETAKLLKEKGFDEVCYRIYDIKEKELRGTDGIEFQNHEADEETITAPTLQMAMKWLREVHKVHIIAESCLGEGYDSNLYFNRWFWTIFTESGEYKPIRKIDEFPTYEQACEDAIKHCLENLI